MLYWETFARKHATLLSQDAHSNCLELSAAFKSTLYDIETEIERCRDEDHAILKSKDCEIEKLKEFSASQNRKWQEQVAKWRETYRIHQERESEQKHCIQMLSDEVERCKAIIAEMNTSQSCVAQNSPSSITLSNENLSSTQYIHDPALSVQQLNQSSQFLATVLEIIDRTTSMALAFSSKPAYGIDSDCLRNQTETFELYRRQMASCWEHISEGLRSITISTIDPSVDSDYPSQVPGDCMKNWDAKLATKGELKFTVLIDELKVLLQDQNDGVSPWQKVAVILYQWCGWENDHLKELQKKDICHKNHYAQLEFKVQHLQKVMENQQPRSIITQQISKECQCKLADDQINGGNVDQVSKLTNELRLKNEQLKVANDTIRSLSLHQSATNVSDAESDLKKTLSVLRLEQKLFDKEEECKLAHECFFDLQSKQMSIENGSNTKAKEKVSLSESIPQNVQELTQQNQRLVKELTECKKKSLEINQKQLSEHEKKFCQIRNENEKLCDTLGAREKENLQLLHSLSQLKQKYNDLELQKDELESKFHTLETKFQLKEQQHIEEMHHCMASLTNKFDRLEAVAKKQQLQLSRRATVNHQSTTTIMSMEELSELQKLERVCNDLTEKLKTEMLRYKQLDATCKSQRLFYEHSTEKAQGQWDEKGRQFDMLIEDLRASHHELQQQFTAYQLATDKFRHIFEARVVFLISCVKETSSMMEANERMQCTPKRNSNSCKRDEWQAKYTTEDIYNTLVELAQTMVCTKQDANSINSQHRHAEALTTGVAPPCRKRSKSLEKKPMSLEDNVLQCRAQYSTDIYKMKVETYSAQLRAAKILCANLEDENAIKEQQLNKLKEVVELNFSELSEKSDDLLSAKRTISMLSEKINYLNGNYAESCNRLTTITNEMEQLQIESKRTKSENTRRIDSIALQRRKISNLETTLKHMEERVTKAHSIERKVVELSGRLKSQQAENQNLKQQGATLRREALELKEELDKITAENRYLHCRLKAKSQEVNLLRGKVSKTNYSSDDNKSDNEVRGSIPVVVKDIHSGESIYPRSDMDMQGLKARVHQKHQLIVKYKTKVSELEELLSTNRQQAESLDRQLKHTRSRHSATVEQFKKELESVQAKVNDLNGLRACIYDSLHLFISYSLDKLRDDSKESYLQQQHKVQTSYQDDSSCNAYKSTNDLFSNLGLPVDDIEITKFAIDTKKLNNNEIQMAKRWTKLSMVDLDYLCSDTSNPCTADMQLPQNQKRKDVEACPIKLEKLRLELNKKQDEGMQLLELVEIALDQRPENCRSEISRVLNFIWTNH